MHIADRLLEGLVTFSAHEMEDAGEAFAETILPDSTIALQGDLGAGKTTFVRGLARGFAIRTTIKSPTYSYYQIHQGRYQLIHLDAYRLEDESSLDALLIEDFLQSPWCLVIEWPSRVSDYLPRDTKFLNFRINGDGSHQIQMSK